MVSLFLPLGFFVILSVFVLSRWVEVQSLRLVCLFALLIEALASVLAFSYVSSLGVSEYVCLGEVLVDLDVIRLQVVFIFDEISAFFYFILLTALILCFVFLAEYFEYDVSGVSIILLSALFSQLAF